MIDKPQIAQTAVRTTDRYAPDPALHGLAACCDLHA